MSLPVITFFVPFKNVVVVNVLIMLIKTILQGYPELGAHLDSRFANDFAIETGLSFQDGTGEQDVCLSDLLTLLQNGNDSSLKKASKVSTTMGSETTPVSAQPSMGNYLEPSTSQTNVHAIGSSTTSRPQIKLRARQLQPDRTDPNSEDVMGQGNASRRIRLQIKRVRAYCGGQFLSSPWIQILSILLVIFVMIISLGVTECPVF